MVNSANGFLFISERTLLSTKARGQQYAIIKVNV
jgi:hypothetical protein